MGTGQRTERAASSMRLAFA
ncbi:rCG26461 [Rattus norvegicus]|uniref:RCG26461 n=1 Tax=Rattus norvegicus TaxID=10116 RepID=A6HP90_RAT|nr:rCG26461 [Rattus norvegicus]